MTHPKTLLVAFTALGLSLGCATSPDPATADNASNADAPTEQAPAESTESSDIVDTAVAAGSFETLVAAVKAADMVDVLKGDGPFTVFAPTDEAFAKLPAGTLDDLLKPENKAKLQAILKYHVVAGKVSSKQVVTMSDAETVEGSKIMIEASDAGVKINEANVIKADIDCTNGVIHVIDSVILPPS